MPKGHYKEYKIGDMIGNLTIIEVNGASRRRTYKCQCVCGNIVNRDTNHLSGNYKKNCGCIEGKTSFKDLTGRKFGQLTAIRQIDPQSPSPSRRALWECQCDCGNIAIRKSPNLISGASKTCKKPGFHSRVGYGESAFNTVYRSTESNAKRRNLEFTITKEQARKVFKSNCYYCGNPPSQICKPKRTIGEFIYNGIDRVDNNLGYTPDNSVPCCGKCNSAKGDEPIDGFKQRIISIYMNWASK